MGLEIAKIQNATLKAIANQADENKDGFIKGRTELNVFEDAAKNAVKENLAQKEDLKATMNLFEIDYPSENEVLRSLAMESDEDKSGKVAGKELDTYVEKAKHAVDGKLATAEDIENTTDGYYQTKSTMQKVGRGLAIAAGVVGGIALGLLGARVINRSLGKSMMRTLDKCYESSGKGMGAVSTKYLFYEYDRKIGEYVYKTTNRAKKIFNSISITSLLAGGAAGGVAVAKATESDR